jgi:hypothetical protein
LLSATKRQRLAADVYLQWAEEPEFHPRRERTSGERPSIGAVSRL